MLTSIMFDGTTRLGELMNVVARWCTKDFHLVQRLIALRTFAKHLNAQQLAVFITQLLLGTLKMSIKNVTGFERDSAAINGASVRTLTTTFTSAENLLCICHTLCHLGEHFELSLLDAFMTLWIKLIYGPGKAAAEVWRAAIGENVKGHSAVRW